MQSISFFPLTAGEQETLAKQYARQQELVMMPKKLAAMEERLARMEAQVQSLTEALAAQTQLAETRLADQIKYQKDTEHALEALWAALPNPALQVAPEDTHYLTLQEIQKLLSDTRESAAYLENMLHMHNGIPIPTSVSQPTTPQTPPATDEAQRKERFAALKKYLLDSPIHTYISWKFYVADTPEFPAKLQGAQSRYVTLNVGELPLLLLDYTVFGSAKEGFLLTDQRLHLNCTDHVVIPLQQVRWVKMLSNKQVTIEYRDDNHRMQNYNFPLALTTARTASAFAEELQTILHKARLYKSED